MRVLPAALLVLSAGCGAHERVPIGRDTDEVGEPPACALPAIDATQLTALGPSGRSHWLQPWRAYRDTWPAKRLLAAPGFQVPFPPDPSWLESFRDAGFTRFTMEAGWSRQSYDAPEAVSSELEAALTELANQANQAGLRPMLLLNAPHLSSPGRELNLTLTETASVGARSLRVSPTDAAQLSRHKAVFSPRATPVLVTNVAADGLVELSRPLAETLSGAVPVRLLRYAPFARPTLAGGAENPEFEESLDGWLTYLTVVSSALRDALGSQDFDIELWNETAEGNNFYVFDVNALYDPPLESDRPQSFDDNLNAIRARSVAWLRAPERNLGQIGISDGSGNMRFSVVPSDEPPGLTALSRHLSAQGRLFPEEADLGDTPSLDALGEPNGALAGETWVEAFTPDYAALFPEQSLTALYPPDARRPAQLTRDLSPIATNDARAGTHQRAPLVEGVPSPDVWLTAASLNLGLAERLGLTLSLEDRLHVQAKTLLRMFSSYVGAGAGLVSIYGPDQPTVRYFDLSLPGGGEALQSLGRFFARFRGGTITTARALELVSIASCAPGLEFAGDGSAAHPDLDHRQLVAFYPFQYSDRQLVVAAWVTTRNVLEVYGDGEDPSRFDLPAERFELVVRGVDAEAVSVTAYDPLRDEPRPISVLSRSGAEIVLAVDLVDYPLLLELRD